MFGRKAITIFLQDALGHMYSRYAFLTSFPDRYAFFFSSCEIIKVRRLKGAWSRQKYANIQATVAKFQPFTDDLYQWETILKGNQKI